MLFRSFFDEQLAHMSYLVGCQRTGEAIVIDPGRNVDQYINTAKKEGMRIVAAAETHIHADFVSGAKELAKRCGAKLYLSDEGDENWKYQYIDEVHHELVREGSVFTVGNVEFKVLHTPGHTPEHVSFILTDRGGGATEPMGIFTGDFVFVGDVGRPDLLEKAAGMVGTTDIGARQMFQSLKKFKMLPDYLQVWPAHGAGSACGKALGAVPVSTVGYEKRNNWALNIDDEETFVKLLLTGQPEPPKYFAMMKKINKMGPTDLNEVEVPAVRTREQLDQYRESGAQILDVRPSSQFADAHYPGSMNIPFNKSFTNWAGWLMNYEQDIVLIANQEEVRAIRQALAYIGLDRVVAYVEPAVALSGEVESYEEIDVHQLQKYLKDNDYYLIDVRNQAEWDEGYIDGAQHIMLGTLPDRLHELPEGKTYIVQCRTGGRSAIGASILQANGLKRVFNVKGGYLAWVREKLPVVKQRKG
ncbi:MULTISPECIES: MBL fold metallo-hydrolase [Geobacillus]|jgi:hydroxyacylglutathione hydrolase|uniref:MBL fold metallo-hydrolase n=1 Tax=Geobacillus TaxID=129337 RepID=UPI000D3A4E7A|nr:MULTISPECIES: rhodanese-like domain-containing protein [Geobacillus]NNU88474.1 MBL fold metallo-hydrolase [Geobacillus sp. MR]PTR48901.1 MBL fold metallo-hydrolase [Geobacillus thermodenitrificans]